MSIKKTAIVTVFVSAIFVGVNFMVAKAYEPLVRIPGLPAAGPINLSQYIVGLYNFLLSIVGIVAVMMLIIGGMKYITAAGNASIVGDAKDTIWNAIFGLLLALLSWVIVSTINPDVLYIKHPASNLIGNEFEDNLGACGSYDDIVIPPVCTCKDGTILAALPPPANQDECNVACEDEDACGTTEGTPCIGGHTNNPSENKDGDLACHCFDDNENVVLSAAAILANAKCNEVCSDTSLADDGKYHGISHDVTFGNKLTVGDGKYLVEGKPLEADLLGLKPSYFDLTKIRDCKNDIISKALDYDGGGPFLWAFTDEVCCEQRLTTCSSWGAACNVWFVIPLPPPSIPIPQQIPLCENDTYVDDTYVDDPSKYLVYRHEYLTSGDKMVWFGVTSDGPAGCQSIEFVIPITVE